MMRMVHDNVYGVFPIPSPALVSMYISEYYLTLLAYISLITYTFFTSTEPRLLYYALLICFVMLCVCERACMRACV